MCHEQICIERPACNVVQLGEIQKSNPGFFCSVTLRGLIKFLIRCLYVRFDLMQWSIEISNHQHQMILGDMSNTIN